MQRPQMALTLFANISHRPELCLPARPVTRPLSVITPRTVPRNTKLSHVQATKNNPESVNSLAECERGWRDRKECEGGRSSYRAAYLGRQYFGVRKQAGHKIREASSLGSVKGLAVVESNHSMPRGHNV